MAPKVITPPPPPEALQQFVTELNALTTVAALQSRIKAEISKLPFHLAAVMKPLGVLKPTQLLAKPLLDSKPNIEKETVLLIQGRARMYLLHHSQPDFLNEFAKFQSEQAAGR